MSVRCAPHGLTFRGKRTLSDPPTTMTNGDTQATAQFHVFVAQMTHHAMRPRFACSVCTQALPLGELAANHYVMATALGLANDKARVVHVIVQAWLTCGRRACLETAHAALTDESHMLHQHLKTTDARRIIYTCAACDRYSFADQGKFMCCSQCRRVHYCSRACQEKDWPRHKHACHYSPCA